jgi:4-hydroxybenzoate polyprenyltransferase
MASAIYCFNDIRDLEFDKKHAQKKNRPLANGTILIKQVIYLLFFLVGSSLLFSYLLLPLEVLLVLVAYLILNILYSTYLKNFLFVDLICIALGFVLRISAGAISTNTPLSTWIVFMVFFLALFLATAKRRDEAILFSSKNYLVRKNITKYTPQITSLLLNSIAVIIIGAYLIYTTNSESMKNINYAYSTTLWVVLGITRYFILIKKREEYANPTKLLLKDRTLQLIITLWLVNFYVLLY